MNAAMPPMETSVTPSSVSYRPSFDEGDVSGTVVNLVLSDSLLPARIQMKRTWTDAELMRFSSQNPFVRFEQEPNGDLTIMSPTGSRGNEQESDVAFELELWARQNGTGRTYNSNGGFRLPDGSMRAADAVWLSWEKIRALPSDRKSGYYPLCPEFVVEIRSENDSLTTLRDKMHHWMANGCELAWLIDPIRKTVEINRPGQQPEIQEGHSAAYGEGPVAGFVLELSRIWSEQSEPE